MAKIIQDDGKPFYYYEGELFTHMMWDAGYKNYYGACNSDESEIVEAWDNAGWQEHLIFDGLNSKIPEDELKTVLHKYYKERIKYQMQYWIDKEDEIFKNIKEELEEHK